MSNETNQRSVRNFLNQLLILIWFLNFSLKRQLFDILLYFNLRFFGTYVFITYYVIYFQFKIKQLHNFSTSPANFLSSILFAYYVRVLIEFRHNGEIVPDIEQ